MGTAAVPWNSLAGSVIGVADRDCIDWISRTYDQWWIMCAFAEVLALCVDRLDRRRTASATPEVVLRRVVPRRLAGVEGIVPRAHKRVLRMACIHRLWPGDIRATKLEW